MLYKIYQKPIVKVCLFLSMLLSSVAYSDIHEIKARGKLRIGMCTRDQPPFYYHNKKGELVGLDINIIRTISKELGVEPEFIVDRDTWDAVVQDVANGRTDIASSYISVTPQRSFIVAFSVPYVEVKPIIVFSRLSLAQALEKNLVTFEQMLSDKQSKVYTPQGSSYYTLAIKIFSSAKTTIYGDLDNVGIDHVLKGTALAYFTDEVAVEDIVSRHQEYKLRIISYPLRGYSDEIALPISYKNPILLSVVNSVLETRKMYYSTNDIIAMLKIFQKEEGIVP